MDERSSPGRYRGRRRVPTTPRSRYAAVVTTAVVGAGVVALGSGAALDNAKLGPGQPSALGGGLDSTLESRADAVERASRAERNRDGLATTVAEAPDIWLLPLNGYTVSSDFGWRWGRMHSGVDLAADHGSPVYAMRAGTVVTARWASGYGYAVVIDHGKGVQTLYAHNSQLLVEEGQEVAAGDRISLVGNTGYSFGPHLHLEIHIDGEPVEPVAWLDKRDVDLLEATDALDGS